MSKRKRFEATTKVSILKRHLQKKESISELCEEHGCTPGSVYQWQETLFSRGHKVFENKTGRPVNEKARDKKIAGLEAKLNSKNAIISELMEELLQEKNRGGAT
jgi:transposase-like protein